MKIWFALAVASIMLFGGCSTPARIPQTAVTVPLVSAPVLTLDKSRLGGQPVARRATVYFATGSAVVSEDATVSLRKTARFLRNHPTVTVEVAGNCDERGSYAYNQRLGAHRAESVAAVLIENGVSPRRVVTGSNGEFKPLLTCHAESCWVMNRRADLIYGW